MTDCDEDWFMTPEEAARGDIPGRYVHVLGVEVRRDQATVWLLTNDAPPFEPYTVWCTRKDGLWGEPGGCGGFSIPTSEAVQDRARGLGWPGE